MGKIWVNVDPRSAYCFVAFTRDDARSHEECVRHPFPKTLILRIE